ncbi:benzoate 4-monooxygenase cytochrome P450 [Zopfia rhizophila CBS 207.26]|uniref:Benzoate 4-monooxygenase cytochrome P450 n=1 Tax=Zopfia rhizophila CBS 207.26 TaxID=1314779 RepID=A0A6A6DZU5_9PEZI|nr:benzoate 4-monooxygenase cytochrome P450 [Zopfia rhizophila CBS 207.26]
MGPNLSFLNFNTISPSVHILYLRYLHPLAKYPGPFFWTVSRIPFALSLQSGHLVHDTKRFHDQYGTIVRLAPNELSFIEPQAWYDIYGHRKKGHKEFMKNPIWTPPSPNGVHSLINAAEKDHPRMRKPLVPAFSSKALRDQEATVQIFKTPGDLGFGEPFNCLRDDKYHPWVSFLYGHLKDGALRASVRFYPWVSSLLFAFVPKSAYKAAHDHFAMSCEKLRRRMALKTNRRDFLSYILRENSDKGMTIPELEATSALLIVAGSESTSTMLTATTNYLVRSPWKLTKLTNEIRSTFSDESEITMGAVEHLPYLRAVLQEGMRMAPPVPSQIPRIVPPEGDIVCGNSLPGNTFVGVPQFAAYRYAPFFVYPNEFLPERWLPDDSPLNNRSDEDPTFNSRSFSADTKNIVQPFSVGPRNCIGMNLAYAEMRLIFARLLYNFNLELPRKAEDEETFKFENQKTFALWERQPCMVEIRKR